MSDSKEKTAAPEETLAEIQRGLAAPQAETRRNSLAQLGELSYSSQSVLRRLEKMALEDRSKAVKEKIWNVLASPLYRQMQARNTNLPLRTRRIILKEIENWEADGLLDEGRARILRQRYDLDLKPVTAAEQDAQPMQQPAKEKRSFAQTLFSETSIKISLYLGAFFIVSAAMIFAAAIEELRLPILFFFTALFGIASLGLKKRLPQPSFTLFIIFSVLLPIDFSVIADFAHFSGFRNSLYWMSVFAFMAGVWTFATWFFQSRFFSLTAFLSLGISALFFADLFADPPVDLYLLMLALVGLVGFGAVKRLESWQDKKFARPLFWIVQAEEAILLVISFFAFLFHYDDASFENAWWLATTATWVLGAVFYFFSDKLRKNVLFRIFAVISTMPLAWLFINIFDANESIQAISFLVWGTLFALIAETLKTSQDEKRLDYGQLFQFGALPLVSLSVLLGINHDETLGFALLSSAAVLYTLLTLFRLRWWTWSFALLNGVAAYFLFFQAFDFSRQWEFYLGYRLLIPSLLLLLSDLFLEKNFKVNLPWRLPPRILGLILLAGNTLFALSVGVENLPKAILIFSLYAFFALGYALRYSPYIAYLANTYLIFIAVDLLRHAEVTRWLNPLIGMAVFFYLLGWGIERMKPNRPWGNVYRHSGLALGTLVALSAPLEDSGLAASIPVVIAAGLFTIEAFRKRNLWLGFPANALYLMAYFMILLNFEIDQPQFYSVAAAALGMLMHYLLVRAGSKTAAFITGLLSQLVLLSATYMQMVSEEQLIYFAVLFFQALVVLLYGIVVRSRSLVITPIIFLVVGVLTVTFGLLEGLPTIFLIGCTGSFLIAFGIGALLLRERVADFRDQLDDWSA